MDITTPNGHTIRTAWRSPNDEHQGGFTFQILDARNQEIAGGWRFSEQDAIKAAEEFIEFIDRAQRR